jgi:hypothetical protein
LKAKFFVVKYKRSRIEIFKRIELIYRYIARQFKNPTGSGGKIKAFVMNRQKTTVKIETQ